MSELLIRTCKLSARGAPPARQAATALLLPFPKAVQIAVFVHNPHPSGRQSGKQEELGSELHHGALAGWYGG